MSNQPQVIVATARLTYNYEVDEGLVSTPEEAANDLRDSLRSVSPYDFEISVSVDGGTPTIH